jgi:sulfide dehydrogenase cytochrome subunit
MASHRKYIGAVLLGAAASALLTPFAPAAAQSAVQAPSDRQVRVWAASCAACHNTDGRSVGGFPALAGRNADDTYRTLMAFRSGERPATIMHQHARGYTPDELRHIANWFAAVKPAR